jgi:hypothetical protein
VPPAAPLRRHLLWVRGHGDEAGWQRGRRSRLLPWPGAVPKRVAKPGGRSVLEQQQHCGRLHLSRKGAAGAGVPACDPAWHVMRRMRGTPHIAAAARPKPCMPPALCAQCLSSRLTTGGGCNPPACCCWQVISPTPHQTLAATASPLISAPPPSRPLARAAQPETESASVVGGVPTVLSKLQKWVRERARVRGRLCTAATRWMRCSRPTAPAPVPFSLYRGSSRRGPD